MVNLLHPKLARRDGSIIKSHIVWASSFQITKFSLVVRYWEICQRMAVRNKVVNIDDPKISMDIDKLSMLVKIG